MNLKSSCMFNWKSYDCIQKSRHTYRLYHSIKTLIQSAPDPAPAALQIVGHKTKPGQTLGMIYKLRAKAKIGLNTQPWKFVV